MRLTAEQGQHSLRRRVGLSHRGHRSLRQYLSLGQIGSFLSDIRIANARLGSREVGDLRLSELNRVADLVLGRTDLTLNNGERRYGGGDGRDRRIRCAGRVAAGRRRRCRSHRSNVGTEDTFRGNRAGRSVAEGRLALELDVGAGCIIDSVNTERIEGVVQLLQRLGLGGTVCQADRRCRGANFDGDDFSTAGDGRERATRGHTVVRVIGNGAVGRQNRIRTAVRSRWQ